MKLNFKSRKFLATLFTAVLIGLGVTAPEMLGGLGADAVCSSVKCDA